MSSGISVAVHPWRYASPSVSRKFLIVVSIVLLSIFSGILQANAWWDEKWQFRRKVVFDTTPSGADIRENLNEVTVLIRLHSANFNFAAAKEDGSDIRFMSDDDKLPLKYQKEVFDPAGEMGLFWVKVPRIMPNSKQNSIWIYYGNKSAPDGQDRGGVYDVNQALVYHLDEEQGKPKDETSYGNQPADASSGTSMPAVIKTGLSLNGSSDRIVIPRSPSLNFAAGFTFSAWVRFFSPQNDARIFSWEDQNQALTVVIDQTKVYARASVGGQTVETSKTSDLPPESWHLIAVTVEPSKRMIVYFDGMEAGSVNLAGPLPEPASDICIGGTLKGNGFFSGDIDEIQLSKVARSAEWLRAAFKGQGPENILASVSEEESSSGSGESLTIHLLKVVAKTITLDGWVVIGALGVLGGFCLIIFLSKMLTLTQIRKGNSEFSEELREASAFDSFAGNENGEFSNSSFYRIYNAGFRQLKANGSQNGDEKSQLSKSELKSVESALNKATMLESRQLGAGLVVLTFGISGGPFLGLFGTVWGIMNTFASMAEAGEANLTAIAPGVASALACTLGGLLVAIPALFAYSFLTHMIKDVTADMYQFTDEFVLKVEGQGE